MKAVGWIASPIISELFKKCSTYLSFDSSQKLRQLGPKVLLLERAMEVFEKIPNRARLEQLFEDLKSAFYEAEDILDDIEYHCLEKKIQDGKFKNSGSAPPRKRDWMKKKVESAWPSSPVKNKETGMSKKHLKDSLEKIEAIVNNACEFLERLNLSNISNPNGSQAVPAKSGVVVTTSAPPQVVMGRDKDCHKIIAMLHENEGQSNTNSGVCYSVVGIHGIAGSGKSTLAQLVCAHEKKDKQEKRDHHFDLIIWVHVSQSFSVSAIFKEMFEGATGNNPCPELNNLNTLQDKLEEELHGKRVLLVLDDVWCNIKDHKQQEELQQILSPLKAGEAGSKILVTSRTKDALLVLGATNPRCIPITDLDDDVFLDLLMQYALQGTSVDDFVGTRLRAIGADIAKKLKASPLAARIVGGRLARRPNAEFWTTVKNGKLVNGTMGALWWSYQHLDQQARRCFAYCSIFPRRLRLHREKLVNLWVAEGFIRSTNEGEEMEDVGQEYFDELVSTSFLQLGGKDFYNGNGEDYYLVHDLLHDLAEAVAGSDCFRIENGSTWRIDHWRRKHWKGHVPQDGRHLFVQNYDAELITEKILQLENLRTLIIDGGEPRSVDEKVIESIFKRLPKLRVLNVETFSWHMLSVPKSIDQLKHLRYLGFSSATLPSTLNKLYHIQLLNLECYQKAISIADLINLRHVFCALNISNIDRLTSLQTLPYFRVRNEQGYEIKQLKDLNKLRGSLEISGLENVKSGEALGANLVGKERLTRMSLSWGGDTRCTPEVEADVLEGLCPPVGLESLEIYNYNGSRYPRWMAGRQNDGPKYLQELCFYGCSPLGPAPDLEAFIHLRWLMVWNCSWDALPGNMEQLTSLKKLEIRNCLNIRSLPTLPRSLEEFELKSCDRELMGSCQITGHPNWQKIEHIPMKWTFF